MTATADDHIVLAVLADTHINSTVGLCRPAVHRDDGGEYLASVAQRWLWECYQDFLRRTTQLAAGARVVGVVNGDALDIIPKSTQLISTNTADVLRMATETLSSFRDICDSLFVVRGTEVHTGRSGEMEEALARELDAERWPCGACTASVPFLRMQLHSTRFDIAHHGRLGRLHWTRANALGGLAIGALAEAAERDELPPHLVIRSHNHISADSNDNYPVRVISTPGFQLATGYSNRIAPGQLGHIGGLLVDVHPDHYTAAIVRYTPQGDRAWTPQG